MIALTFDNVDNFVEKQQRLGRTVRWDGWSIIFFNEDKRALRNPKGRRVGDKWGFETRINPTRKGMWLVNPRLVNQSGR